MRIHVRNNIFSLVVAVVSFLPETVFAAWNTNQPQPASFTDFGISAVAWSAVIPTAINYILALVVFWNMVKFVMFRILSFMAAGDEETISHAKSVSIHAAIWIAVSIFG